MSDAPEVVKSNTWGAALERICTWAALDDRHGTVLRLQPASGSHLAAGPRDGDFNAGESNPVTKAMAAVLRDKIDYIFVEPSDHFPVVARIRLR